MQCDECKSIVDGKEIKPKYEKVHSENNAIRYYFTCPCCNKKYICFYTDDKIEALLKEKAKINDIEQQEKLQQKIVKRMEELKEIYNE